MLETLQHPGLFFEALSLGLGQLTILHTGQRERISHTMQRKRSSEIWRVEVFTQTKHVVLMAQHDYSECDCNQIKQEELLKGGEGS